MSGYSQVFLFLCGIIFFMIILMLLLKHRISEKPSILWLTAGFCILVISGFPGILDDIAGWLGIGYPPSLLFFLSTLILLGMHLYQSMEMTKLQRKIAQLSQHIALMDVKNGLEESHQDVSLENEREEANYH